DGIDAICGKAEGPQQPRREDRPLNLPVVGSVPHLDDIAIRDGTMEFWGVAVPPGVDVFAVDELVRLKSGRPVRPGPQVFSGDIGPRPELRSLYERQPSLLRQSRMSRHWGANRACGDEAREHDAQSRRSPHAC